MPPRSHGRAPVAPIRLHELGSALATVIASLISGLFVLATFAVGISFARLDPTHPDAALTAPIGWGTWLAAAAAALGLPLVLAVWKHGRAWTRVAFTMSWLPAITNCAGLILAAAIAPGPMSVALRGSEHIIARSTGDTSSLTQAASALGHESARLVQRTADPTIHAPELTREVGRDDAHSEDISLGEEGNGVFVDVELVGPAGALRQKYLFDTGASYTTITRKQARELGIEIPADAPSLDFNTAAGTRSSPMVYLPRLRLGNVELEGILVSVCDPCATDRYPGLLGINVMREFHVELDYQDRHMRLIPRIYDGPPNRSYDIEPMLELAIEGRPEVWMRNIRWTAKVTNRGAVPVRNVIPKVEFDHGFEVYGQPIPEILPGQSETTIVRGRLKQKAKGAMEFTLSLAQAQW